MVSARAAGLFQAPGPAAAADLEREGTRAAGFFRAPGPGAAADLEREGMTERSSSVPAVPKEHRL